MHACAPLLQEPTSSGKINQDQEYPALLKGEKVLRKVKPDALLPAYHRAKITEVVEIPCEQRRYQNDDPQLAGRRYDAQSRICSEIVKETGVDINLTCSKTNTLTIVLTGQPDKVVAAKRSLIAELQQQINVPPPAVQGSVITITGKREGVIEAAAELQRIHEEAKLCKTIPVRVKRSQHRLVFGPRGSGLAEILGETGVSVELPTDPTSEEIILRGKPEDLGRALTMVYERAESSTVEEIHCPNRFHKLLIGKRGSALNELVSGYERVHIEFGEHQDKILLEGPPEEVGFVMERLKSRIAELEASVAMGKIRVDPKYFRHIVGRQGATILKWRENKVQIHLPSFEKGDHLAADEIVIEGDPQGV
ncbi:Vigilin, partial [Fasciola gigantica]